MKNSTALLAIAAFATPIVASELVEDDARGTKNLPLAPTDVTYKNVALGVGALVGLYGLLADSTPATAVGVGLFASGLTMSMVPERKLQG